MKIGVDFGTTYTKIAYVQDGELKLFRYPGSTGWEYNIPTALAYRREKKGEVISIGEAAREEMMNYDNVQFAERFKMLLPIRDEREWAQRGWNSSHRPEEVTREFFYQLLRESEYSLERTLGAPESMVVSIPELWQRTPNNFGAEALRRVLIDDLKLPVDHLRSEPICAAAYFVYEYQRCQHNPGDTFNLLVCDVGGGTFDVALCQVRGQKIDVLDFDGMGQEGLGSAGALFDYNVVHTALLKCGENPPPDEIKELLWEFERHKIQSHDKISKELWELLAMLEDGGIEDTPVYQFRKKYSLTLEEVMKCFAPIADAISQVLTRITKRCEQRQLSIDRIAIVGGFGQFPLVQHTIFRTLGIHDPKDVRFDKTLHSQYCQFYAIAYGAALIANGLIEPIEYYPPKRCSAMSQNVHCPVCNWEEPSRKCCPQCGWELESEYILGGLDEATLRDYEEKLEKARQRWRTKKMELVAMNPYYESNLNELDGIWDFAKVIGPETVLIVTGCFLGPELLDRPVAGLLRDEIDRRGKGGRHKRGIVIGDMMWLQETWLHSYPVIAVGAPRINAVATKISEKGQPLILDGHKCGAWVAGLPQVALWGELAVETLSSVERFIHHAGGLHEFLKLIWQEDDLL